MGPQEIEQKSFAIIDTEAGSHGFAPQPWQVVRRMIHTTADFDYLASVRIHPRAIEAGTHAIRSGRTIFTDTHMLSAGIRARDLARFDGRVCCLTADPAIARKAVQAGSTRTSVAVDAAVPQMTGGIYAVGNAPTALLRLVELLRQKQTDPALVIGLPVGFVNAAESKAALRDLDIPYITNVGRKGGSNVAASVINALLLMASQEA